jgi:hypothetical protein
VSFPGFKNVTDGLSQFNIISFIASQMLAGIATAQLFQVQTVTPGEGLLPGVVSGQIMVNQVGATNIAVPHGPIYNVPFFRLQGGKNAVIVDPVKDDIGIAIFASRDISSVKATKAISNPGSARKFDYADGLYLGGFLNGTPTQYVQFVNDADGNPNGIHVVDALGNTIATASNGISINGVLFDRSQNVTLVNEVTAVGGHTLTQHTHTQGVDSHGDTEVPTNKPTG